MYELKFQIIPFEKIMRFTPISSLFFIFSGMAALIYQSVWSKYLALIFGHSALSQTAVLCIFMGGMGLGAWTIGRFNQRVVNALKMYAYAELLLGLLGLCFHIFYQGGSSFLYTILPSIGSFSFAAKVGFAILLVGPQCFLLGATFPLLSRAVSERCIDSPGRILSTLYFANSAGAAFGALICVFYLIPSVGLPGSIILAGSINLLIALAAIVSGRLFLDETVGSLVSTDGNQYANYVGSLRSLLIVAGLSGACSFLYEIGWIRLLILAQGSSVHSFEIMLSSFIFGLAFGAFLCRYTVLRSTSIQRSVANFQILKGVAVLCAVSLYLYSFSWVALVRSSLTSSDQAYYAYLLGSSAVSFLIMFIPATFAGFTLPLFTLLALSKSQDVSVVGRVYAWNTFGSIIGIFVASNILIEIIGLKFMLIFGAFIDISCGLYLVRSFNIRYRDSFLCAVTAVALIVALLTHYRPEVLSSGAYRYQRTEIPQDQAVVFMKDGKTSTVSVLFSEASDSYSILTNGKPDASLRAGVNLNLPGVYDEATMIFLSAIPLAYKSHADHAAVIGWGSGMSSTMLAASGTVKEVTTIEIERQMYEGSKVFQAALEPGFSSPKLHIIFDDAKSYFYGTDEKFDIIMSEPSNPWISGVANLFSDEFYQLINKKMTDDGVFVQWLQAYEFNDKLFFSALKALDKNFLDYHIYSAANSLDLVVVASKKRMSAPIFPIDPYIKSQLARLKITSEAELLTQWVGSKRVYSSLLKRSLTLANSDFFPNIEVQAPKAMFKNESVTVQNLRARAEFPIFEKLEPALSAVADVDITDLGRRRGAAIDLDKFLDGTDYIPKSFQNSHLLGTYLMLKSARVCPTDDPVAISTLRASVASLNPVFSPVEAAGVWEKIGFCRDRPQVAQWIELFRSVGVRDFQSMKRLSEGLLKSSKIETDYLLKASAFASFALEDCPAVSLALAAWQKRQLNPTNDDNYLFQIMDDCRTFYK